MPDGIRAALGLPRGERVLDWTTDTQGTVLVATATHLYAVSGADVVLRRPWHLVDAGRWNSDTSTLTVTWVDGERRSRWSLDGATVFLQALRERVQASVVLSEAVELGEGRGARVVLRRDLASGGLLGQTILGRGVRAEDPGVRETTEAALAYLKEQVGLD
jgi:hypothetical protein